MNRNSHPLLVNVPVAALSGLLLVHFGYASWLILREAHILNFGEGINLLASTKLLHRTPLYADIHLPPYDFYAYGPVYPAAGALAITLLGPGLLALRLVAIAGELLTCAYAFRLMVWSQVRRPVAAGATALLLGVFSFHKFHALARVDFLMMGLVMAGAFYFLRYEASGQRRDLAALVIAFTLAALTKMTAVLWLPVCGLYALIRLLRSTGKDRSGALRSLVGAAVAIATFGVVFLLVAYATGGEFYRHQVRYQSDSGFDWGSGVALIESFLLSFGGLLLAAAVAAPFARRHLFICLQLVSTSAWFVASSFKNGADVNYYIEAVTWMVPTLAVSFDPIVGTLSRRLRGWATGLAPAVAPVGIALALSTSVWAGLSLRDYFEMRTRGTDVAGHARNARSMGASEEVARRLPPPPLDLLDEPARADRAMLDRLVRETEGEILAEEPYFAVANGKPHLLGDSFLGGILMERGVLQPEPLVRACAEGRLQRVFAGFRIKAIPGMLDVLNRQYRIIYETTTPVMDSYVTVYERKGRGG